MPIIAMPILACVLGKYLMFPVVSRTDWIQTGYCCCPSVSGDLSAAVSVCSSGNVLAAVQQGLEHVDLTLQFVDTTYLLRNQQVA